VIDRVSNRASPRILGSVFTGGIAWDVTLDPIAITYAYVATGNAGLKVIRIKQ
jgi:hypothetical protein